MNAMPLLISALAIFALAYRFYFGFISAKVLTFDESRQTPANRLYDGQNYYPMSKWILFGQDVYKRQVDVQPHGEALPGQTAQRRRCDHHRIRQGESLSLIHI